MQTDAFIATLAGHSDDPGHQATPDDELRALIETFHQADVLIARLSARTNSPTRAMLAALTVERAKQALEIAQLKVAVLARAALVHELPAETLTTLRTVADDPASFVSGETSLPQDPRTVPTGRLQFKTPADCLGGMLGIDYFEAVRRLRAADDLLPGVDDFGLPRGPRYPQLAGQLAAGKARLAPTAAAARKLEKLRPGIEARPDAEEFTERAEARVAESVAAGDAKNTTQLFHLISDELDDTDAAPTPAEIRDKTGCHITKRTRHFTYFTACMLNLDAEVFLSHFAASDNARTLAGNRPALAAAATNAGSAPAKEASTSDEAGIDTDEDADANADAHASHTEADGSDSPVSPASRPTTPGPNPGSIPQTDPGSTQDSLFPPPADGPDWFDRPPDAETFDALPDSGTAGTETGAVGGEPTPAQRHLQTLLNLMRAPRTPAKGATGLPTSKLFVYINLETLTGMARGAGWTAHGLEIPLSELRKRLAEFSFIPIVLGGDGEILDYGRERRYPPESMKQVIRARDRGCLGPGCTVPPEHCEFHHIKPWSEGGTTSVSNLGMFCTAEHRAVDKGDIGIVVKNGVPWVVLPEFEDPGQVPRRNTHWLGEQPPLF
ncbi:HNH endonuclease [Paeniglutamicibacter sp. MACA_103]|uniref:HNH endonuclease signature motif containing protein n=1 Tax=Paeniglutamicibacter sp. MACA_103 TaxID=3377337 RepID=UPI00389613EE